MFLCQGQVHGFEQKVGKTKEIKPFNTTSLISRCNVSYHLLLLSLFFLTHYLKKKERKETA